MSYQYTFTVFTPTYNRAGTLPRVYESLRLQTFRDFEWLVVDDGSSDGTEQLVKEWQSKSEFPIRYIRQPNQGKPAATNRATSEAHGELLATVDSDDCCVPESLERLKYYWDAIPADEKDKFAAVTALCKDQNGHLVGDKFPHDVWDSDAIELYFKHTIKGDKWGFQRTDAYKEFPFPTPPVPNPRFNCEGLTYLELSRKYKTRFVNEILKIYHINDGADDHLSLLDPATMTGPALFHKYVLDELTGWLFRSPWKMFRSAINFSRYSFGIGRSPFAQLKELHSWAARLLVALALPLGYVASFRDKRPAT
jgi:glycosyltransferase involved in cell wall biosynthesis